jgi:hypothetical protein
MMVRAVRRLICALFFVTALAGASVVSHLDRSGHHCVEMDAGDCIFSNNSGGAIIPNNCSSMACGVAALLPMAHDASAIDASFLKISALPGVPELCGLSVPPALRPPIH